MFFYSRKLVKCCKCGKKYSFDDNLFFHNKDYILMCPYCGLQHEVDISLLSKRYSDLKKIQKLGLESIDVGCAAIDRALSQTNRTLINKGNPANADGTITNVEYYLAAGNGNVKIAIFEKVDTIKFTTRDYVDLGTKEAGYHSDNVSLEVKEGDYLGIYSIKALDYSGSGGDGVWLYWSGTCDAIPCTNQTFDYLDTDGVCSVYGTGETGGGEVTAGNPLFMFQNFLLA
jgi:transcription elongation factor Elf1